MKKHDLDNRSRQLNPRDATYKSSRAMPTPAPVGEEPRQRATPKPDAAPALPPKSDKGPA